MRSITDHIVEGDACNHQVAIDVLDVAGHGGANHEYLISWHPKTTSDQVASRSFIQIGFQNGPIKECGVNGVTDQSLVALVIDRYRGFQSGQYSCADNVEALAHLEAFMECSKRRTKARIARGVEGTHEK